MPRKNKPNSAMTTRRQKTKRGRQDGVRKQAGVREQDGVREQAGDGLAEDFARAGDPTVTGTRQQPAGRVLAVDYGERRVGLALSDPAGLIAQGLDTLKTAGTDQTLQSIVDIVTAEQVREVILGLPVHMDGTPGEMAGKVEAFAEQLRRRVTCDVRTWDERLTSVSARRAMQEMGSKTRGDKGRMDRIAATLLLQNYLDFRRGTVNEPDPSP